MATVEISGTVARTFFEGRGAEVVESFTVKGREVSKRWTAWFQEPHGLSEGDSVKVSGLHSDEVSTWADKQTGEAKQSVKRSLNNARVLSVSGGEPFVPAVSGDPDDETPF